jgi:hypothetical protein
MISSFALFRLAKALPSRSRLAHEPSNDPSLETHPQCDRYDWWDGDQLRDFADFRLSSIVCIAF